MAQNGGFDGGLLGILDRAADLLRAAGEFPLGGAVSDVELTQAVQKLEALGRIASGQKLAAVAEIAGRQAFRGQSAASIEDLLVTALHLTPGEAKAQAELAVGLAAVPDTAKALRDGRVGISQATVTVKKAAEVKDRDDAEQLLAAIDKTGSTAGQQMNRTRLARELDATLARSGADVLAAREDRAVKRRGVWFGERDGLPWLEARLPVDGYAAVKTALDALGKPDGAQDARTVAQRHADALVLLATKYLDDGKLPSLATMRPHTIVITTPDALAGADGAEPSVLDGVGPISPTLTQQLTCDARITDVVIDPASRRVLDARPARPVPTRAQRLAVIARDQGCVGCGAPVTRCEVHHVHWRRNGGATVTGNLTLVCWTCHRHIHHHGWQITRDATGRYRAGPPQMFLDNSIETEARAHTG